MKSTKAEKRVSAYLLAIFITLSLCLFPLIVTGKVNASTEADYYDYQYGPIGWYWQYSTSSIVDGISAVDENNVWAVSYRTILNTRDGGTTWSLQSVDDIDFRSVSAGDPDNVWVLSDRIVLKTTDGGKTWKRQNLGIGENTYLWDVLAIDPNTAWVIGDDYTNGYPLVLRTDDGGNTWKHQDAGTEKWIYFRGLAALDSNTAWVVGEKGTILKTTDGGNTWNPQESGTRRELRSVSAVDSRTVWAVGNRFAIIKTTDGGTTWKSVPHVPYGGLNRQVVAFDAHNAWVASASIYLKQMADEYFYTTNNGGKFWRKVYYYHHGTGFYSMSALDQSTAWAGLGSSIYRKGEPLPTDRACAHDSIGVIEPSNTWYLAEGATLGGFETWVLVQNPGDEKAKVNLTYMTDEGEILGPEINLAPKSRKSINVGKSVTTYNVSTRVISDKPVVAERSMYYNDRTCAHDSIGVTEPSNTWYLTEGATLGGFETWVLVQNPGDDAARVELTLMTDEGEIQGPEINLSPKSRESVNVGDSVKTYNVSTRVTSDKPVVAERSMYYNDRTCAHDSIGVIEPANTWYLAEGATLEGFETWVLVMNPGDDTARVALTFMTDEGEKAGPVFDLPPRSRESIDVGDNVEACNVSTRITSDKPVVAERSMYYNNRTCAHDSIGVTDPANTWYLAEGAAAEGFETWVLVMNPGDETARVNLNYMTKGGEVPGPIFEVPPKSRESINVAESVNTYNVSTMVESDKPVVVERSMYGGRVHDKKSYR